jgi:ribosomal protein S18 acetylase RimI-like enzyme
MGRRTRPLHATLAVSSAVLSISVRPAPVFSFVDTSLAPPAINTKHSSSFLALVPTDNTSTENDGANASSFYFIREADFADLGSAAKILTDGFYGDANFITYNIERLNTFLSLESTYPQPAVGAVHSMLVACRQTDGKVLGFAEIDGRPTQDKDASPRPYMCNLAVSTKWRRRGLAKALVQHCEEKVLAWGRTDMYLKVREANDAATDMYKGLGYDVQLIKMEEMRGKPPQSIVLMKKELAPTKKNAIPEQTVQAEDSPILR